MSHRSQDESGKLALRPAPRPQQRVQKAERAGVKAAKPATKPTAGTSAQRQVTKPVNRPSTKLVTGSSTTPGSATLQSQNNPNVPKDNDRGLDPTLRIELEGKHPKDRWFDGHGSLDKMTKTKHRIKNGQEIWLSDLQVPVVEKGNVRHVGLQEAVRNTIFCLLGIEAKWNPITLITNECLINKNSKTPLWKGKLWLGGIRDSGDAALLTKLEIEAVVSIHPPDWLWDKTCGKLFKNGIFKRSDKHETGKVVEVKQYHIDLPDDPSSNLLGEFEKAFEFIDSYLSRGKNVLVHCKMGQSRSASLVLGCVGQKYYEQLPPEVKKSTNLNETLSMFTTDLMKKRKGIKPENFKNQVLEHLTKVAKGNTKQPSQQTKPTVQPQKKGGGGIVKDAILVYCFITNVDPTEEILEYWLSRHTTNIHYWIEASKIKNGNEGRDDNYHLAVFNKFFEDARQRRARQRRSPSA